LGETLGTDGRLLRLSIDGQEAGWVQALDEVAGRLADVIARHGPDSVAFYVSGQLLRAMLESGVSAGTDRGRKAAHRC
jgi:assimilatory nitrate reductase catalytic subunit